MNKPEATKLLALIKIAYPAAYRDMDEASKKATVNMWQMSFPDVPYPIMEQAFNHFRMVSKFPPTVAEMVEELGLKPGQMGLIVNRAPDAKLEPGVLEEIEKQGLTLFGVLPHSEDIYRADCAGEPSAKLPGDNPVKQALAKTLQSIGI